MFLLMLAVLPCQMLTAQFGEWDLDQDSQNMGPERRALDSLLYTETGEKILPPALTMEQLFTRADLRVLLDAEYVEALDDIDAALDMEDPLTTPTLMRAYQLQATCFRGLGDYASAAAAGEEVIALVNPPPEPPEECSGIIITFYFDMMMDYMADGEWQTVFGIVNRFIETCDVNNPEYYLIRARAGIGKQSQAGTYSAAIDADYFFAEDFDQTPLVVLVEHAEYLASCTEGGSTVEYTKKAIWLYRDARDRLDDPTLFPAEWNLRLAQLLKAVSVVDPSYPPSGASTWQDEMDLTVSKVKNLLANTPESGKLYGYLALCYFEEGDELRARSAAIQGYKILSPSTFSYELGTCEMIAALLGDRSDWYASVPAADAFAQANVSFACSSP